MTDNIPSIIRSAGFCSILLCGTFLFARGEKQNTKYNILFIAVDDLKPEIGCYGNKLIKTPNIDRIASQGTIFLQNYCQQAICGPTRASLMTGKRPDYTKVWDLKTKMRDINPDILSIPQYFAQQGFTTAGIGKIYDPRCIDNSKDQDKPSWSVPYFNIPDNYYYQSQSTMLSFYQNPETRRTAEKYYKEADAKGLKGNEAREYVLKFVRPSVESMDLPDNAYNDGAMANRAVDILAELSKNQKPFFFAVGFARPHLPFVAPKKYWDMYNRDDMPLAKFQEHAKNSPELAYHNSGEMRTYTDIPPLASFTDIKINRIGLPAEKQKELIHGYYAAVSYMDAQLGKVLHALDSLGIAENTIIVLWGDHGWHLGDHDLWCKHTNFENATRAPLIISAPGINKGITESTTEFVDIFPTLCDLTGLKIPKNLDGKSLLPLMKNPEFIVNNYAVSQYPHKGKMGYSIRTKQYRLTWWMENGFLSNSAFSSSLIVAREFYDYANDPLETENVISEKKNKKNVEELEKMILQFFESQRSTIK